MAEKISIETRQMIYDLQRTIMTLQEKIGLYESYASAFDRAFRVLPVGRWTATQMTAIANEAAKQYLKFLKDHAATIAEGSDV